MAITISGSTDTISAADGSLTIAGTQNVDQVTVGTGASVGSPATNVLTLGTNDTERLRIDSSGNVGVGTDNPTKSLDVNSSALINELDVATRGASITSAYRGTTTIHSTSSSTNNPLSFVWEHSNTTTDIEQRINWAFGNAAGGDVYANAGYIGLGKQETWDGGGNKSSYLAFGTINAATLSEKARIDSSGRLLINGTTSQTWSGGAPLVQVSGTSASGTMHLGAFQYSDSSDGGELVLGSSRGTTVGSATTVQNGDTLGRIRFCAADGNDLTNRGGEITCAIDGTPGSDDIPTRMMFYTAADGAGSPTERMRINNEGRLYVPGVYNFTSGTSANVVVDTDGQIRRATSSQKYKTDIETLQDSYADALLECRPVWYRSTADDSVENPHYGYYGFIAEEVAEIDPRLVYWKTVEISYDEKGSVVTTPCDPEPEGVQYDRFVPHLLNLIKRQKEQLESQAATIAALDARLTALESA